MARRGRPLRDRSHFRRRSPPSRAPPLTRCSIAAVETKARRRASSASRDRACCDCSTQTPITLPTGSPIAVGDSVLITMTVIDPTKFVVQFQPAGLRFSSASAARLQFEFHQANHDFNGNGVIDSFDSSIRSQLAIWRQEAPGLPWAKLSSKVEVEVDEVSADLLGFSGYA